MGILDKCSIPQLSACQRNVLHHAATVQIVAVMYTRVHVLVPVLLSIECECTAASAATDVVNSDDWSMCLPHMSRTVQVTPIMQL